MEQFVRDARIAMIYEGANGIQALDLVGRKLMKDGGRAWQAFFKEIDEFIADNDGNADLKPYIEGLADAKKDVEEATQWLAANAMTNFNNAGAGSTDYLYMFALLCLAHGWANLAKAALDRKAAGDTDAFFDTKLITGKYFLERVLPDIKAHLAKLKTGADTMMSMPREAFVA